MMTYALFYLLPLKIKLQRRQTRMLSNDELNSLADKGDAQAAELKRRTRLFLYTGVVFATVFVCEKYDFF